MSDLRIGLVAEGKTDLIIIEAALRAIMTEPFVLTLLQPEATQPRMGEGWNGVLKWCYATSQRFDGVLDDDPTLAGFDLLILHLDVDVAAMRYSDGGALVTQLAQTHDWGALPCVRSCPPVIDSCNELLSVLRSWLGGVSIGERTVVCLPAQSSGTWLAASYLPSGHRLLAGVECNDAVEEQLKYLTLTLKIKKKSQREYRKKAGEISNNWRRVTELCRQAQAFEDAVRAVLSRR
ncbi:MAG: hypothetical protein HRT35_25075 [Algicola sp.]|nr:hypothetical protein [Algicola sp.]